MKHALARSLLALAALTPASAAQGLAELRRTLPDANLGTVAAFLADLDGDARPDALLVGSAGVTSFAGDGLTTFRRELASTSFAGVPDPPGGVSGFVALSAGLADLDRDGDLDLWVGSVETDLVLENVGGGAFALLPDALPAVAPNDERETTGLAFLDAEGDGDTDVVAVGYGFDLPPFSEDHVLFLNDGSAHFTASPGAVPAGTEGVGDSAAADLDGDGASDIVLGVQGTNRLLVGGGDGTFSVAAGAFPDDLQPTTALALGDVDRDGDLDVLSGNAFLGFPDPVPTSLYLNDGAGGFEPGEVVDEPAATADVALADLDGDGSLDAYVANLLPSGFDTEGANDRVLRGDGAGRLVVDEDFLGGPAGASTSVSLADVDGDGDLDALVGALDRDRLLLGSASGRLVDVTQSSALGPTAPTETEVEAVDVDGDALVDLVVATFEGLTLHRNAGDGTFAVLERAFPGDLAGASPVTSGDVDGDGDVDLVRPRSFSPSELLRGDGGGTFKPVPGAFPDDGGLTAAIGLADLRGAGVLDAVAGKASVLAPGSTVVYRNDGSGAFTTDPAGPATTSSNAFAFGDVDDDGAVDLLAGSDLGARLLSNDGNGNLAETVGAVPPENERNVDVALADLDGDGDLDAYVANSPLVFSSTQYLPGTDRVLVNDGAGGFTELEGAVPEDPRRTAWVRTGDLDGNGTVDVVLAGTFPLPVIGLEGAPVRVLLNDGSAAFTAAPDFLSTSAVEGDAVLADVDLDGDLDAVLADGRQLQVHANLALQLARVNVPRSGAPLGLELHGPPDAPWFLFLLDPPAVGAGPVAVGRLNGDGEARVHLRVPVAPALVGTTLRWRARVGGAATNLELTTITDL